MNYQPNNQPYPPQQPYQGQQNPPYPPQQPMMQPPMQQMQMSQPMPPMQQMPQPMHMSQPMQPMMQPPMQQPPMQQMGYQEPFAASQPFMPMQAAPVQEEKQNPLTSAIEYVKEHQLYTLAAAAVIAVIYLLFILLFSHWNLGRIVPFLVTLVLSIGANGAAIYLRNKIVSLAAGALYVVAMLLFLNYFFILLPSAALCALDFFTRQEE